MSVIEVKFGAPWLGGGVPSFAAAWSVFADLDGTTAWAFEAYGGGFARFNLSDGSIIRQGVLFGSDDSNPDWVVNFCGVGTDKLNQSRTLFFQDTSGFYYLVAQYQGFSFPAGAGTPPDTGDWGAFPLTFTYLFKFKVGAGGSSGSVLDGYDIDSSFIDIVANMTAYPGWSQGPGSSGPVDGCLFTNGGVNYIALISGFNKIAVQIIDTDTMTYVDSAQITAAGIPNSPTDSQVSGVGCFADSSGTAWGVAVDSLGGGNVKLLPWSGTFGTPQFIPQTVSTLPISPGGPNFQNAGYLPATNSVVLSDDGYPNGYGNVAIVSMSTFTLTSFIAATGTLFFSNFSPAAAQSMDEIGVSSESIVLEGGVGGQTGGVINFVDPSTLAVTSTINASTTINSASPADPIVPNTYSDPELPPFTSLAWSPTPNKLIVTYGVFNLNVGGSGGGDGSPVYILDAGTPPPPPTIDTFTATPSSICRGTSSTLTWDIEGTYTSASIDNGVGTVETAMGTAVVSPTATTTYTLTVDWAGSPPVTAEATVTLLPDNVCASRVSAVFSLQKLILSLKMDTIPDRGKNR